MKARGKILLFPDAALEKLFKGVFDTVREPLLVLDTDLRVVTANQSFYKTFKTNPKATKGLILYALGNDQWDIPLLRDLLKKVLKTRKPFNNLQIDHSFPRIGHRSMLLNARLLKDSKNGFSLILLAIEDVTAFKKHQEQLVEAGKFSAIGQLSAGIAHSLNSPLTGLTNFIKAYQKAELDKSSTRSLELSLMLNGCKYMSDIIHNLTYFARDLKKSESVTDLNEIVKDTLIFSERQFVVKNIKVEKEFVKQPDKIKVRKSDLQQMFLNLIMNSSDAMDRGGRLTIRTKNVKSRKGVILEIIDTGKGIPENIRSRIFEPFFTTKEDTKGTGLGLFVAYRVVRENEGTIEISSQVGKGTRVSVFFPAVEKKFVGVA
jgi:signal transduction histidine kinase